MYILDRKGKHTWLSVPLQGSISGLNVSVMSLGVFISIFFCGGLRPVKCAEVPLNIFTSLKVYLYIQYIYCYYLARLLNSYLISLVSVYI